MRRALWLLFILPFYGAAPACAESIHIIEQECGEQPAESLYDKPQCAEYELNTALMVAAQDGDATALGLLEKRYWSTVGYQERHRIARVLLRRVANDRAIWDELFANAQLAVRFADVDKDVFEQWCDEHGFYWLQHPPLLQDALSVVASDPRSHALLVKAVKAGNRDTAITAIIGLSEQRDLASLPAIDEALARFPGDARYIASVLDYFQDERADAIAKKYVVEEEEEPAEEDGEVEEQ